MMYSEKDLRAISVNSAALLSVSAGRPDHPDETVALLTEPLQGRIHPSLRYPILSQLNNATISPPLPRCSLRHPR